MSYRDHVLDNHIVNIQEWNKLDTQIGAIHFGRKPIKGH